MALIKLSDALQIYCAVELLPAFSDFDKNWLLWIVELYSQG